MKIDIEKQIKDAKYNATDELSACIFLAIRAEQNKEYRLRMYMHGVLSFSFLIVMVPVIQSLVADLSSSGIFQYASLIFSDSSSLSVAWQELSMSIVDVLPGMSIALFAVVLFALSISIRNFALNFSSRVSVVS
ncbi:MAG: hypothetical protein NTX85_01445 [Candidatus Nomurabacteria bacterium]|nr:hypothetical protein [Candidatus Nomurabacteria bacterium]